MITGVETAEGFLGYDEELVHDLYVYSVLTGERIRFHLWEMIAR